MNSSKNILITGISGRVGSSLAASLLKQGHKIYGYDIQPPKQEIKGIEYLLGQGIEVLNRIIEQIEVVAHLGAFMSWNPADHVRLFQQNVQMTFELLEKCAGSGITRFVFASTGEVYPEGAPQYLPIDEQHPCEPSSVYGETKKIGEELLRFFGQRRGLETVILRFPHTQVATELLNPDSFFSGPRFFLQAKIKQMRELGNLEMAEKLAESDNGHLQHLLQCCPDGRPYQMHITDVRDTVAGIKCALFHPKAVGEIFNLGFDQPARFDQALKQMKEITGLEVVKISMPGAVYYQTSNEKAKTLLGYSPRYSFDKMLEEAAVAWHKEWRSKQQL